MRQGAAFIGALCPSDTTEVDASVSSGRGIHVLWIRGSCRSTRVCVSLNLIEPRSATALPGGDGHRPHFTDKETGREGLNDLPEPSARSKASAIGAQALPPAVLWASSAHC